MLSYLKGTSSVIEQKSGVSKILGLYDNSCGPFPKFIGILDIPISDVQQVVFHICGYD